MYLVNLIEIYCSKTSAIAMDHIASITGVMGNKIFYTGVNTDSPQDHNRAQNFGHKLLQS